MLELGVGADVVRLLGWVIIAVFAVGLVAIVFFPRTRWQKALGALAWIGLTLILFNRHQGEASADKKEFLARRAHAEQEFIARCANAGEKIKIAVGGVDSIFLDGLRNEIKANSTSDQYWSDAGMPWESTGNEYIMEFLMYRTAGFTELDQIIPKPIGHRGYSNVVIRSQNRLKMYRLRDPENYHWGADPVESFGIESETSVMPRYIVAYRPIDDPAGRALWIAGAKIQVIDSEKKEILAELTEYAFDPGLGSTAGGRQPWLFTKICPQPVRTATASGHARRFVEKVLLPKNVNTKE